MSKVKTQAEGAGQTAQRAAADEEQVAPLKASGPSFVSRQAARGAGAPPAQPLHVSRLPGAAARAQRTAAMQRTVGNARLNRALAREAEEGGGLAPPAPPPRGEEKIQPLAVSHPDDASEREAESVARSVVEGRQAPPITPLSSAGLRTLAPSAGRRDEKQDDKPPPPAVPSASAAEDEQGARPPVQREADGGGRAPDTSAAAGAIARKGAGSPVEPSVRRALEPRLGADLSAARVHSDSDAAEAAQSIGARAFTHGQDIFLARGESGRDTRLMAHELTHVVQQTGAGSPAVQRAADEDEPAAVGRQEAKGGPAVVSRQEKEHEPVAQAQKKKGAGQAAAEAPRAPGFIDLRGMTEFTPPAAIDQFLDEHKEAVVEVRYGTLAEGPVEVKKRGPGKYAVKRDKIPLRHPALVRAAEAFPELTPSLVFEVSNKKIEGFVALAPAKSVPSSAQQLASHISDAPELLGLVGFAFPSRPKLTNKLEAGKLHLGLAGVKVRLGSAFDAVMSLEAVDSVVTFSASAQVKVKGLAEGALELKRDPAGVITGAVSVALELTKEFSGAVTITWAEAGVSGSGKVGYKGEKMQGELTLVLMERGAAAELEAAKKAPPEEALAQAGGAPAPAAKKNAAKKGGKPAKLDYVAFGEGDLTFAFNDWLNGTAHVIVDPAGFVTIIGKITPQKEFPLFEPKEFVKPIFKVEARASYGIPVVGNIFIFANFGMDAFAKLEGKLYNITAEGTYSTDPEKAVDFQISGSLNISAAAGLLLSGEAGAGMEILDHDLKAGAGINAALGVKAYAKATPVIGYREQPAAEGEDKKGEFFIRGDVEVAAQPFLGLSGDLFVEVDSPWWSPLDDEKWTWPLFNKEYPLGGSFGLLMSVDYVFGSGQWPAVEFKPAEFDADKFTTDLYEDRAKPKSGDRGDLKGAWKEKNEPRAEPPAEPKTEAKKEKPKDLPPAKPKVKPGGPRKQRTKEADPNARTAEGKSVKQLQEEAKKKGRKPKAKGPKGVGESEPAAGKDPAKAQQSEELPQGLAALHAAIARHKEGGVTAEEMKDALASVRRKFKVFKSIRLIDDGDRWDVEYTYNPTVKEEDVAEKPKKTPRPKELEGKSTPNLDMLDDIEIQKEIPLSTRAVKRYVNDWKKGSKDKTVVEYVEQRAAKKLGLHAERPAIDYLNSKYGFSLSKNTRLVELVRGRGKGYEVEDQFIPDFFQEGVAVGDVKRTKALSYDPQMKGDKRIADADRVRYKNTGDFIEKTSPFHLVVRAPSDDLPDGTDVSGPLRAAVLATGGEVHKVL